MSIYNIKFDNIYIYIHTDIYIHIDMDIVKSQVKYKIDLTFDRNLYFIF